jgi:hypothetical protein
MPLLELNDLLASPDGVDFLASHGIFLDHDEFTACLPAPAQAGLTNPFGAAHQKPVYALQQIYVDCTQSMLDRMVLLARLEPQADCFPFFLWIDTDLAGTDILMLRLVWPLFEKRVSVRLSAAANDHLELRSIPIEIDRVQQALDKLEVYLSQSITGRKKVARGRAKTRYEALKGVFLQSTTGAISELNHRVTYFLLHRQAGLNPVSMLVSDLLDRELLTAEINGFLNHLEAAIRVFNQTVEDLQAQGINPQVKPLAEHYLPLHVTCSDCRRRLRLSREIRGYDHYAVTQCKCGHAYRFYLGSRQLSMDEIAQGGPWSPDVCLTLFLNDFVSGYIAGGSSGIYYGLVMKEVLEHVLQKRRVPILLPSPASVAGDAAGSVDSLLYRYLMDQDG